MKNKILLSTVIFTIITLFVSNFVYAVSLTNTELKTSLKKMLNSEELGIGTITVNDSNIVVNNSELNLTMNASYNVNGEKVTYTTNINQADISRLMSSGNTLQLLTLAQGRQKFIKTLFLSVADAIGVDQTKADEFYTQKSANAENASQSGDSYITNGDAFVLTETTTNENTIYNLDVYINKLANLGSSSSTQIKEELQTGEKTTSTESKKTTTTSSNKSNTNTTKQVTSSSSSKSNTTSNTDSNIPYTGASDMLAGVIVSVIISIILFIILLRYRDVR